MFHNRFGCRLGSAAVDRFGELRALRRFETDGDPYRVGVSETAVVAHLNRAWESPAADSTKPV